MIKGRCGVTSQRKPTSTGSTTDGRGDGSKPGPKARSDLSGSVVAARRGGVMKIALRHCAAGRPPPILIAARDGDMLVLQLVARRSTGGHGDARWAAEPANVELTGGGSRAGRMRNRVPGDCTVSHRPRRVYAEIVEVTAGWVEIVASRHATPAAPGTDRRRRWRLDSKRSLNFPAVLGATCTGKLLPGTQRSVRWTAAAPAGRWLNHTSRPRTSTPPGG